MIKHLILNNLILVESCEVHFSPSFNVVTGETGAGKTALIEAVSLALGSRADSGLVRKGFDRAFIEIAFEIPSSLTPILEEAGIETDDLLIIRREISKEGKNRALINCRTVPLPLLQKIGEELIDLVGQGSYQSLMSSDAQRALVDLFGETQTELKAFQEAYTQERDLQKNLDQLQQLALHRQRDEDTWRIQIEEIESVALKKGEEEAVFEKYQRLANAQEISEKVDMMTTGLSEAILPQLSRFTKACESLAAYDSSFKELLSLIHEAHIVLSEAHRTLQSQEFESNPNAFQTLETRLSQIAKLKRKYGQTFDEIDAYHTKIKTELDRLENLTDETDKAKAEFDSAKLLTDKLAKALTIKRTKAALKLQKELTWQLQQLNMAGSEVIIEFLPSPRTHLGDDLVQFWLKANPGENPGLVKEHASGGELSRLLFAVKVVLAERNNTPTLIFDEIDANVGGKTAAIIGEKLLELGKHRQVICITHFPQTASKADTHFSVQKIEEGGRTKTEIQLLTKKDREKEMLRMLGADTGLVGKKSI